MKLIKLILVTLCFILIVLALFLAFSIGLGFLLHLMLPSVELGLCIIIVLLAIGVIVNFLWSFRGHSDTGDEEIPEDKEKGRIYLLEPNDFRRRRKKRSS